MRKILGAVILVLALAALPAVALAGPGQGPEEVPPQPACPQEHLREMDGDHAAMHAQMEVHHAQMGTHMGGWRGPGNPSMMGDGS